MYVEDFKRGTNKDIGPKDNFEVGSKYKPCMCVQIKVIKKSIDVQQEITKNNNNVCRGGLSCSPGSV